MRAKDVLGRAGEDRAVAHLIENGYRVVERNWRCPAGEIDVVAETDTVIAIVEVKTRRSELYGHPLEAIDARKRARLWRLACTWAAQHPHRLLGRRLRIDAIAIVGDDPAAGRLEHLTDIEVP
ncbi:YraN family protein [Microbacterium awajiense]|uniref:UPF0102 protein GCM10022200_06590 n=1 Tax=Microbacterium awajiense TaxID=415214 RepID=A0ABP7A8J8_9MICO